ncbi:hypothetical protein EB796_009756 [Bugula neritina]|uniref:Uncharacterized protein n=1 Tax=Bugula neritina TaxID=10212 RepID=A0A7J7K2X6_BUGNE|nr:hypothetical protein EB796_009756 [Bugula neritina]
MDLSLRKYYEVIDVSASKRVLLIIQPSKYEDLRIKDPKGKTRAKMYGEYDQEGRGVRIHPYHYMVTITMVTITRTTITMITITAVTIAMVTIATVNIAMVMACPLAVGFRDSSISNFQFYSC